MWLLSQGYYCIIVFFLGVWGVYIRENISSLFRSSSFVSLLKENSIDLCDRYLKWHFLIKVSTGKHIVAFAPLIVFPYWKKTKHVLSGSYLDRRRKHTITSAPLLFFVSLLKEIQWTVWTVVNTFENGILFII